MSSNPGEFSVSGGWDPKKVMGCEQTQTRPALLNFTLWEDKLKHPVPDTDVLGKVSNQPHVDCPL